MKAPLVVRPLTDAERQHLTKGLRSPDAFTLRRCQALLASARGATARRVAEQVGCSDQAVRDALRAFNRDGRGAPARRSPRAFGKDPSLWTPPPAAEVCQAEGLTAGPVSGETVRATLARLGAKWQRATRWLASPDPAYARKKASATAGAPA